MRLVHGLAVGLASLGFWVLCLPAVGCGGSSNDCDNICNTRASAGCNNIVIACSDFCSALDAVDAESTCTQDTTNYSDCLDRNGACADKNCSSESNAWFTCHEMYCAAHTSDANCKTLAAGYGIQL